MGCPCKECSYFKENPDWCTFMDATTEPDRLCWAKMYEFVKECESDECDMCSHFGNKCVGDRETPITRMVERFHYGQGQALSSKARIILVSAGKQSGKTAGGPLWMYHQMQMCGSGDYLSVSSSYPLMQKKLIPEYLAFFSAAGMCNPDKDYIKSEYLLKINGQGIKAKIFFGSAKNAASLESSTALAAHLDEAGQDEFSLKAYDAILGRLSRSGGKIFITTTVYNLGWLYHKVYVPFTQGDTDYDVIQFESIMSPGFSKVQFEWLRSKLPDWQFAREYQGLFARPTGMIYSDFDEPVHIIEPFDIPPAWNWHVGIDPGAVNTALVWAAVDPETDKVYLAKTYKNGNMTTPEHVTKAKSFDEYKRVIRWVGGAGNEQQFRDDWTAEGIPVIEPEVRHVESGINRVSAALKEKRVFIFDTEENKTLIEEFRSYSRVLDETGGATDRIKDKNLYHMMDALRYLFAGIGSVGDYGEDIVSPKTNIPLMELDSNTKILKSDGIIPVFY